MGIWGVAASYAQDGQDFVLSLAGNADASVYEHIIESLTYANQASSVSGGERQIGIILTDADEAISNEYMMSLRVYGDGDIIGTTSDDVLYGSSDDDLIYGLGEYKTLTGNAGADNFVCVDVDGGVNNFVQIADIQGITGLTAEDVLVRNSNLLV